MSNAPAVLRQLIIYALCLPLAIFLGYVLPTVLEDLTSLITVSLLLLLPLLPILLRWHHLLLVFSWNMSVVLIFPGRPNLWIAMVAVSLVISLLQNSLNQKMEFAFVPSLTWPLIFLAVVVIVTAKMTGGVSLKSFGGSAYGGKRYFLLLAAIAGYFALTCHKVPPEKGVAYVSLYLLGYLTAFVGSMAPYVDPGFSFIFWIFPMEKVMQGGGAMMGETSLRLGGLAFAAMAGANLIIARHGLRGLFNLGDSLHFLPFRLRAGLAFNQPWRILLFFGLLWVSLLGGFRSVTVILGVTMFCQFYLEGLFRSRLLPAVILCGILFAAICAPLADKLPYQIQRSLSFLPVSIDPVARYDAEGTSQWRLRMWRDLLPEVPKYLWAGKGYAINPGELELAMSGVLARRLDSTEVAMLAGDYHNGPLSLIIPLGIYGTIGFLWFVIATWWALYNNYKNSDPRLRLVNTFILSYFIARAVYFFAVYGSFYNELMIFTGLAGLSVSINGGVRRLVPAVAAQPELEATQLAPALR